MEVNAENSRDIGALASWHRIDFDGILHPIQPESCFFISIEYYIANIVDPKIDQNKVLSFKESISSLVNFINNIQLRQT